MLNIDQLEALYQEYAQNLSQWTPEGIIPINLPLLNSLNLLHIQFLNEEEISSCKEEFYLLETEDKLILYNQEFVIWIVPSTLEEDPATLTFIALNNYPKPRLEAVLSATGVFNTSKIVLGVLGQFLKEIKENERTLHTLSDIRPF